MNSVRQFTKDTFKEFAGTRTRFQRLSDYRLFHGWIQDFFGDRLVISSSPDVVLVTGQEFSFEAYGPSSVAMFTARLEFGTDFGVIQADMSADDRAVRQRILAAADIEFDFVVTSDVKFLAQSEEVRVASRAAQVECRLHEFCVSGTLLNSSANGMGLITTYQLEVGDVYEVTVATHIGTVTCQCQCRYSRPDKHVDSMWRSGMKIVDIDRIARARWNQIRG